jgi:uroporphyrinogen decarboxylase
MNSRERVLTAIRHESPDRVPIDLGGVVSGIHINAYKRLLDFLSITDNDIHFYDFNQQIVCPCEEILQRLHIDTRYLHPPASLLPEKHEPQQEKEWVGAYDQFGVFWGNRAATPKEKRLYYSPVIHPLENMTSLQEIHSYQWPNGKDPTPFEGLKDYASLISSQGEYARISRVIACIYEYTTFMFGLKRAMRLIRSNPELIQAAMEELLQYWTDFAITYLNEIEGKVDVICLNGDLADQNGPLMNPKVYQKLVMPIEGEFVRRIREHTQAPINYHSCGSVYDLYPYFIELGYNAVNPVQISARDMNPEKIKNAYGDKVTFWGGACDSQKTLPFGTPDQIKQEVKANLTHFKPKGGYVASNVHNITAEVPPENIVAMFDALFEYGNY